MDAMQHRGCFQTHLAERGPEHHTGMDQCPPALSLNMVAQLVGPTVDNAPDHLRKAGAGITVGMGEPEHQVI